MTERRSRGTRRSSNCFQICSALVFLVFMMRVLNERVRVRASWSAETYCRVPQGIAKGAGASWDGEIKNLHRVRGVHRVHRAETGLEAISDYFRDRPPGRQGQGEKTKAKQGRAKARPYKGESDPVRLPQKEKGRVA